MDLQHCSSIFKEAGGRAVSGRWGLAGSRRTRNGQEQEMDKRTDLPQGFTHHDLAMLPPHTQVNVKNSVEELVKALLKQARTDLEKVRAIWMWICHHIGRLRSPTEDKAVTVTPVPFPWLFTLYLWVISMWGLE